MPWKESCVMDQRKEFVIESMRADVNFTELCRRFSVSTKTGYKWKKRFIEEGFAGLMDQSKRPVCSPSQISEDMILEIIRLKIKKKHWGPLKIREIYSQKHPDIPLPSLSSFERILKKAGLVEKRRKKRRGDGIRIENPVAATRPNQVWTVDFKGWWYTPEKEKINPLTIRDEYSKFIFSIKALEKGDIYNVRKEFERVFRQYGMPDVIRSDNGPPFASMSSLLGLTKLSVWWMALGIKLDRIEPGSPYQNGGHERMHLDMARELEGRIEGDMRMHQTEFDRWRKEFNTERPHQALGMKTPESFYIRSESDFIPDLEDLEYPGNYRSRRVNDRGCINLKRQRYFIGNPFAGYYVGIKPVKTGEQIVWFGDYRLGILDNDTMTLKPERRVTIRSGVAIRPLPMS